MYTYIYIYILRNTSYTETHKQWVSCSGDERALTPSGEGGAVRTRTGEGRQPRQLSWGEVCTYVTLIRGGERNKAGAAVEVGYQRGGETPTDGIEI